MSEELKPIAWLRFWAWQGFGSPENGPDNAEGYEVCEPSDKGIDGSDAFPVYATQATPDAAEAGKDAAAVQAVGAKSPTWYMRDNHTFRPLHGGPEEMVSQCLQEFDAGYTCGMLCSKERGITVHAHGKAKREEFIKAALAALRASPAALPPSGAPAAPLGGEKEREE